MSTELTLTPEQRAIVEHPLEPLRVSAGAGTGKTTTVVERLARAIEDGIEPEEALGVTFTNKAAEQLADKLRRRLPELAQDGREVEVTTYHGLAHRIVTEFGAVVGVERDFDVVGPGYVRQLLTESVGHQPFDHLDLTALSHRIAEAAALGAQTAGNLKRPADIVAGAPDPSDDTWGRRLELARILGNYETTKRELGVVDFGDLIRLAHEIVATNPDLAARIRRRYRAVVLDEYQDTDPAQRRLLQAIFGDGFPVTAVGDRDQTIYEWRGASLENFAGFVDHFLRADGSPAETLPLTENRRSGPAILHLANEIRALINDGPVPDPLRPASPIADTVVAGWFRTAEEEARWIATEILRLHDEEHCDWRQVAVLFRRNRSIGPVRQALAATGIPFEVASLGGLIEVPEVADVHAWLRILARPEDSVALARVLLGGRYRLGLGDLAPPAAWVRARHPRPDPDLELPYPLLEAIDRMVADGAGTGSAARLAEFRATYRRLLADAQGCTLVELIRRVIDAIDGWADIAAMPPAAGLTARLNLYRFLDLAEDWSPLDGHPSLDGFLGYLDLLAEENAADELDTARVGAEDAVSLLTVHRAKGLEWDTVFLPDLVKDVFPSRAQVYDDPTNKPYFLPYQLRIDAAHLPDLDAADAGERLRRRHRDGELRTAYVAVTRAKTRLVMTGGAWPASLELKNARQPSELLTLAAAIPGTTTVAWSDEPGPRPQPALAAGGDAEAPDPHFADGWRAELRRAWEQPGDPHPAWDRRTEPARRQLELMLENLPTGPAAAPPPPPTTSVTGLVTLASCPKRFYWSEVDPLPRRPAAWLRRGSETHRRIELHHQGVRTFDDIAPDSPPNAEAQGDGRVDPFDVFAASRFAAARPRLTETPIDLAIGGVRVRGRIDAVFEPEPGWWEIIDWKSGCRSDDPAAVVQLEAYAVAADRGGVVGGTPQRITAGFVYLGSSPAEEVVYEADAAWLGRAEARLEELAARAAGDVFDATPGAACGGCDFLMVCAEGRAHVASQGREAPVSSPDRRRSRG